MIDGLDPRGSTNLTGGMMRGVEEAQGRPRRPGQRSRARSPASS